MRGPNVRLMRPRDAAKALGISYSTLKRWILLKKIQTVTTPGGHHRVPERELDKHLHVSRSRAPLPQRRADFRRISARNQLVGRIVALTVDGLMAQISLSIGGQRITSVITADAVREMRLRVGQQAAALIKSTEVMILRV